MRPLEKFLKLETHTPHKDLICLLLTYLLALASNDRFQTFKR